MFHSHVKHMEHHLITGKDNIIVFLLLLGELTGVLSQLLAYN